MTSTWPGDHPGALLSALLDGELGDGEAADVRAHVTGCASCRADLAAVGEARAAVRALPWFDVPDLVVARLRRSPFRRRPWMVAAAAAAGVAAGLVVATPPRPTLDPHVAALVQLHGAAQASLASTTRIGSVVPVSVATSGERMMAAVSPPFRVPEAMAGGFTRVATYRSGGVVHVIYNNGIRSLSLFAQAGRLAREHLPAGARAVRVGRWDARVYPWSGGEGVTWQSGPVIYTVVGPAGGDLVVAAASVPRPSPVSAVTRLRRVSRAVADALAG